MILRVHNVRIARLVTDVLAPGNILIGLLLVVGWRAAGGIGGLAWGVVAALVCGALPLGVVLFGVRRRWWTDVHVSVREQRFVPFGVAIAANLAGIGLLLAVGAPRELIALVLSILAGLAVGAAITTRWKVSGHTAVAASAATVLVVTFGPWAATTFLALPVVAWSRVALRDHTAAQAVAGLLLGAVISCAVFIPLR